MAQSLKCSKLFSYHEAKYDLPKDTLFSISLQETGRSHSIHKHIIPWPWAVNLQGKPFYFNTKSDAVDFVKLQLKQNKQNIDVGCMQINLKYHGHNFISVEHALDPKSNIDYGAKFLSQNFAKLGNWYDAISNYHSAKPEFGQVYSQKVFKIAQNIEKNKKSITQFYKNKIRTDRKTINNFSKVKNT